MPTFAHFAPDPEALVQTAAMNRFPIFTIPVGKAKVFRDADGIDVRVRMENNVPGGRSLAGQVVTMWGLPSNDPSVCGGELCSPPDHLGPSMGDVVWVSGELTGERSAFWLRGRIVVGDLSKAITPLGNGLKDPFGSEIHLLLRSHGLVDPATKDEAKATPGGGCLVELDAGELPDEVGECVDWAATAFFAP